MPSAIKRVSTLRPSSPHRPLAQTGLAYGLSPKHSRQVAFNISLQYLDSTSPSLRQSRCGWSVAYGLRRESAAPFW